MELRAIILPSGVTGLPGFYDHFQFNFYRTRQVRGWATKANGVWDKQIDEAAGTIDEDPSNPYRNPANTINEDSDLHGKNDIIWTVDTPGIADAHGDFPKQQIRMDWNFVEWVELLVDQPDNMKTAPRPGTGIRIADDFPWHSVLTLLAGVDRDFMRDLTGTYARNEIDAGAMTIGNTPEW